MTIQVIDQIQAPDLHLPGLIRLLFCIFLCQPDDPLDILHQRRYIKDRVLDLLQNVSLSGGGRHKISGINVSLSIEADGDRRPIEREMVGRCRFHPEMLRIDPCLFLSDDCLLHRVQIRRVGDAEPLLLSRNHADSRLFLTNQPVRNRRQNILTLQRIFIQILH